MPISYITSFSDKDSNFIYPTVISGSGSFASIKPNALITYVAGDFSINYPALVTQSATSATSIAVAWATVVNAVNSWITTLGPANICVKYLTFDSHSFSATSHTVILTFIVNRG